ncbi:hypothetical protein KIN20_032759 [Parelaphostrongylus tenuis]|uniref:Saposin B-type domain-containing protein n=1 Tax=Parelaphostrongylus tenuis TaxID=148309 RepID=A0AAD5R789_PARTN|nr:hypothetical protein KIN20_032759 [Parelaphostrongylus tenuis]
MFPSSRVLYILVIGTALVNQSCGQSQCQQCISFYTALDNTLSDTGSIAAYLDSALMTACETRVPANSTQYCKQYGMQILEGMRSTWRQQRATFNAYESCLRVGLCPYYSRG